jgi:hypothetical protein
MEFRIKEKTEWNKLAGEWRAAKVKVLFEE